MSLPSLPEMPDFEKVYDHFRNFGIWYLGGMILIVIYVVLLVLSGQ